MTIHHSDDDAGGREVTAVVEGGRQLRGLVYDASVSGHPAPVCLCVHGLGVDANVWRFVAPRLRSRGITVLCLDLPGHGLSDPTSLLGLSPGRMATDVFHACASLGVRPGTLIGQSYGACVGLELLLKHQYDLEVDTFHAVTPVWTAGRKPIRSLPRRLRTHLGFLGGLGRKLGFRSPRSVGRRDHCRFAGHPDAYLPRFEEEAASVSWFAYARMLTWLRAQEHLGGHRWHRLANLPVQMVAARDDGLWNNRELEAIHACTEWPLRWMDMRHVSISTEERYADPLIAIVLGDGAAGS